MVDVVCNFCRQVKHIPITEAEHKKIMLGSRCIQDVVPNLEAKWREMFISGMCPDCWGSMFAFDDDEDEEDEDEFY